MGGLGPSRVVDGGEGARMVLGSALRSWSEVEAGGIGLEAGAVVGYVSPGGRDEERGEMAALADSAA